MTGESVPHPLTAEYACDTPEPEHNDEPGSVDRSHRVSEGDIERERHDHHRCIEHLPGHAEIFEPIDVQLDRDLQQEQRQDRDRDVVQNLATSRGGGA